MKTRPTAEEHEQIGSRLNAIHSELQSLHVFLDGKYPRTERFVQLVESATRAVDKARCEGDNAACREHSGEFSTHWYYGTPGRAREVKAVTSQ